MKFNFTRALLCLTAIVFSLTDCKKSTLSPLPATTDVHNLDSLASQIVSGYMQSLNGKIGNININDGIKAPTKFTANNKGPVLFSTQPMCGYMIDTAYTTSIIAGDTTKLTSGNFNFIYTCSTNYLDGYKVKDSVEVKQVATGFYTDYKYGEDLTVKALDNTYKLVSVAGNSSIDTYSGNSSPENSSSRFVRTHQGYNFFDTQVDLSTGKPYYKGEASFIINATDINGKYVSYTGIMFFGRTKVILNVERPNPANGSLREVYEVDLITGKVKFTGYA